MVTIILSTLTASHPAFKTVILLITYWADLPVTIVQKLPTARHMDGLSPTSCRYVVHYKEAVRECQCMRLFMTYWELEETNRLRTLLMSLYAETNMEFHRAEQHAQALLKTLITKQSLTHVADDAQYLNTASQSNKTSLRETDAQLDLMRDHIMQRLPVKLSAEDSDSPSHCIRDSPSTTHDKSISMKTLAHPRHFKSVVLYIDNVSADLDSKNFNSQ
ncbi:uncharacterized protein EDB93DRAFT_1100217 [Suillus bovinus]|uniref:uncharacterized protein n=1 Tax=Suillus bovinus TaxID=48563 RepID=UPI001B883AE9|nr:uncharacterized protein EDB93DRAFT_1100217 [Suillus bovinus]KAG2158532.1 hypothetical protein EDB93DRAFT_1100217 [Suillus bovinus]